MEDINTIYHNHFGIAFYWKSYVTRDFNKIQLVFRNTGLLLTKNELVNFSKHIKDTIKSTVIHNCKKNKHSSRSILLQTPNIQTTLAVNYSELIQIEDLVKGVLFELEFKSMLKHQSIIPFPI